MELRQLRSFIAIAELGSVTLAAERLFLTQPALSHQIKGLERELGVTLFQRRNNRFLLTPAGEEFSRRARGVLRQIAETHVAVAEIGAGLSGLIRVAAGAMSMFDLVIPAVAAFRQSLPNFDVQLLEESTDMAWSLVEHGDVNLAVGLYLPSLDNLSWEALHTARGYAVLSPGHPLASRSFIRVEDLGGERLLMVKAGRSTHFVQEFIFHLHGLRPTAFFESDRPETILRAAEYGLGVAVVTDAISFDGYAVKAVPILHGEKQVETTVAVGWQPNRDQSEAEKQFIAILKEQANRKTTAGYEPWRPQ